METDDIDMKVATIRMAVPRNVVNGTMVTVCSE
jgi:hypothetical protein